MRIATMSSRSPPKDSLRADLAGRRICIAKGMLAGCKGVVVRKEHASRWLVKLDAFGEGMYCVVHADRLQPLTAKK